ncbi:exopolysaccharide biosynthesis protein [Pseudoxanthomonas suwonensis]|uniref:Exopolysaccharide biosynthesis protein n=1 Tax=Pseudoxanthomonas suwonensis TaxID=314722 RepID=A0A0E3Z2J1_9GAMM|nr:exopolysaccharide biosynthesis protein [Pseudoxanthomonas suwonensis]AKC87422.1 exopolysaccharide biosynthesis protein [Pseudoxanthomonas suwonensis]
MAGPILSDINDAGSLGDQLEAIIAELPEDQLTLGELLQVFGDEGLLLLTILLTLVFLIPVSIPGVSTVFGAAILLVGVSRLFRRPLWLPAKLRERALPAARLRPALTGGLHWVRRLEKISRPYRLRGLVDGRAQDIFNNLAFILAALLLMAPFGFIPFSNTLPGLALLFYAIGMIQRDGTAILLGHLANIGTIVYFGILIGGGGLAAQGLLRHFTG